MSNMMNDIKEMLENDWESYKEEQKNQLYPNIMLIGRSGVGKSSLINYIFDHPAAKINDVEPQTQETVIYKGRDFNQTVNLIDTAGYELGKIEKFLKKLDEDIKTGVDGESIHIIWYCISVSNERFEEIDAKVLNKLMEKEEIRKRVCVIFTKCDMDEEDSRIANTLKSVIKETIKYKINCFETTANEECRNDEFFKNQLNKLIEWSADNIDDEDLRTAFIASQKQNLELKAKNATKISLIAAAAAAAVGAAPIPFADAAWLLPLQSIATRRIFMTYGLNDFDGIIKNIISGSIMATIGKAVVGNIIKLIPGVGQVAGAAINATVAATLTAALCEAVSQLCYKGTKAYLNGKNVDWMEIFNASDFIDLVKDIIKGVDVKKLYEDTKSVKLDKEFTSITKELNKKFKR